MFSAQHVSSNAISRIAKAAAIIMMAMVFQIPAQAQTTKSDDFLKAVEKREGTKATQLINEGWVNTKKRITKRTALHIVVDRRDTQWLVFLLQKDAKPDVKDRDGLSPLMLAVELNYAEGVEKLLKYNANVDYTNRSGETPLIKAVNLGFTDIVRILLKAGADPEHRDIIQGYSARDYATRNPRAKNILAVIVANDEERKKAADGKNKGKGLDFSGVTAKPSQ